MAATALTLKSALAHATEVYGNRTTRCLTRDFKVATNLENRASFDELMERVATLPLKEGEAKKDRLIVILRLLYDKPKEPPKKEDAAKSQVPKAMDALKGKGPKKKLEKALFDGSLPEKSKRTPQEELQEKLTYLLIAHDIIYMFYKNNLSSIKLLEIIDTIEQEDSLLFNSFYVNNNLFLRLDPSEISNPAFSAFLFQWAKLFDPKTYVLNVKHISYEDYQQLNKLRSHPDPVMRKICNFVCLFKEMTLEGEKMPIQSEGLSKACDCLFSLQDEFYRGFCRDNCPKLIELFSLRYRIQMEQEVNLDLLKHSLKICKEAEVQFFEAYKQHYKQLHEIQEKHYSKTKEKQAFLSKYNHRLDPSFIPGKGVIDTFLPPDQLFKELSLASIDANDKKVAEPKEEKKKKASHVTTKDTPQTKEKQKEKSPTPPQDEPSIKASPAKRPPSPEKSQIMAILEKRELSLGKSSYDKRVNEWFSKRKEVPLRFTPDDAVWKHAFTTIVDQFVGTPYSFKDVWKNEKSGKDDICFCIMADITFANTKETVSGVFQFTFDEKGICYHRWFGKMSNIERLDKLIVQKREKIDFPPLMKPTKPSFEEIDQTKFAIDPYFGSITFDDKENGLIIKIYKVRD